MQRARDRLDFDSSKLVTGIYFYKLQSGNLSKTKICSNKIVSTKCLQNRPSVVRNLHLILHELTFKTHINPCMDTSS